LYGHHKSSASWNSILLCIVLILWREQNYRTFSGVELSLCMLKDLFLRVSYKWMTVLGSIRSPSLFL
jgi:hypothetical protein